ncbi:ATP-binding protein [Streptomyces olivaceus]|uniref:ATP-binding protein n=1 Tax=Streptomyces olivaceus TaxID=47716 RepID=A0ABS7W0G4_STROV|nr:ATP-binding protein [Streptomyces olivaceus]MBZ6094991.1 ATP-binding protein [Streptomyces olivaceus]MBZ6116312.1 ATP-binding protein [Streptomyces olivaceus]MBZ6151017.1 ATP-binding protein [Streptomyces olivaceus]MBZ6199488.1 ATP-binding protein [Streptomyces olivaceus]
MTGEPVSEAGATSRPGELPCAPRDTVGRSEWPGAAPYGARPAGTDRSGAVVLRVACSHEGFARARVFTRDTLRAWSLEHCGDDAALVVTELVTNAVTHAVPSAAAGAPEVRLGLVRDPGHLTLAVSDSGDNVPVFDPSDDAAFGEHGRGLGIVDALAEEWGWTPRPPAGKTVWAKLPTRPLI